jgi:phospholipid/cholesterol/gamma-HCH transport system substrate-binding protein
MSRNLFETLVGALVLGVAAWFLMFFMKHNTAVSITNDHYSLFAKFEQADGISVGTPVRVGGVKVGVVVAEEIDPKSYFAVVKFSIDKKIKLPTDSTAKISSEGLIGGKYLALVPGADDKMLDQGEEVKYTQSAVNLETLIGKMIFSKENKQ